MRDDFMIYSVTATYNWFSVGPSLEGAKEEHANALKSGNFARPLYRIVVKRKD